MKEAMKAALVRKIVSANVTRIVGPEATHLIREIVDQIFDELGIAECAATTFVDAALFERDSEDAKYYAEERLRSAIAFEIVKATPVERVEKDQLFRLKDSVRLEMRCLVITRVPGSAIAAAIRT